MGTISSSNTIAGAFGQRRNAGVPTSGTTEVQTLAIGGTPTGGTFRLSFRGQTTAPIAWSAANATLIANIDAALEALGSIGTGGITTAAGSLTAGIGTVTLTFAGSNALRAQPAITIANNSLTGTSPTLAVAETTPGVNPTQLGAPKGALLLDTTNVVTYQNTGTGTAPAWAKVGTQS